MGSAIRGPLLLETATRTLVHLHDRGQTKHEGDEGRHPEALSLGQRAPGRSLVCQTRRNTYTDHANSSTVPNNPSRTVVQYCLLSTPPRSTTQQPLHLHQRQGTVARGLSLSAMHRWTSRVQTHHTVPQPNVRESTTAQTFPRSRCCCDGSLHRPISIAGCLIVVEVLVGHRDDGSADDHAFVERCALDGVSLATAS